MEQIKTQRLILRALTEDDADAIYALRSDPLTFKYVDIKPYETIERANRFIKAVKKDIDLKEALFWGIEHRDEQVVIGTVCVWNYNENHTQAELGYELNSKYYGQGYMHEAITGVLEHLKQMNQIKILDAITHEDNIPSLKLLEKQSFTCLGKAIEVDPELDEPLEMLLFRLNL